MNKEQQRTADYYASIDEMAETLRPIIDLHDPAQARALVWAVLENLINRFAQHAMNIRDSAFAQALSEVVFMAVRAAQLPERGHVSRAQLGAKADQLASVFFLHAPFRRWAIEDQIIHDLAEIVRRGCDPYPERLLPIAMLNARMLVVLAKVEESPEPIDGLIREHVEAARNAEQTPKLAEPTCACVARSAAECVRMRYPDDGQWVQEGDECTCSCHDDDAPDSEDIEPDGAGVNNEGDGPISGGGE